MDWIEKIAAEQRKKSPWITLNEIRHILDPEHHQGIRIQDIQVLAQQYIKGELAPLIVAEGVTPQFESKKVTDFVKLEGENAHPAAMVHQNFLLQLVTDGKLTLKDFPSRAPQLEALYEDAAKEPSLAKADQMQKNEWVMKKLGQHVEGLIKSAGLASGYSPGR
ncbi:MAG: hypothetical protein KDD76_02375 [Rickettsiales bacterium]|nr:hypothetical protein [Rickettsiales bacterium]